jgi:hypothetical protein
MPTVLGAKAMAGLERVEAALGIASNHQCEILLFEANATIVVGQPAEDVR